MYLFDLAQNRNRINGFESNTRVPLCLLNNGASVAWLNCFNFGDATRALGPIVQTTTAKKVCVLQNLNNLATSKIESESTSILSTFAKNYCQPTEGNVQLEGQELPTTTGVRCY